MLACDLIIGVRAARAISAEQIVQLEKLVFGDGAPTRDQLDLFYLIDAYLQRRDLRWAELLARAAGAAPPASPAEIADQSALVRAA